MAGHHARHAGTALTICHIIASRFRPSARVFVMAAQHNPLAVRTMMLKVPGRLPECHQFGTRLTNQRMHNWDFARWRWSWF